MTGKIPVLPMFLPTGEAHNKLAELSP